MDRSFNGIEIQAVDLQKGLINLTTGSFTDISLIHCDADGDIILTWDDDTTTTVTLYAGEDRACAKAKSISISSGTFTLSR